MPSKDTFIREDSFMPQCPRPECRRLEARRSHRKNFKEMTRSYLFFQKPYRCPQCGHRFMAGGFRASLRALGWFRIALFSSAMLFGALIVLENHISRSFLSRSFFADSDGGRDRDAEGLTEEERARRAQEVLELAKKEVVEAILLHRSGNDGVSVAKKIRRGPDDPVYKLIAGIFKKRGVSAKLLEESLRQWTEGVPVIEIGRRWQEKGIKVQEMVNEAERNGLPVRKFLLEKDTLK